ncbi:MAG TPA: hypothetical protein VGC36_15530 [Rhizomicrobium sp.]
MPAYDICYLEEDGTLACAFTVQFESEMRAKILAHAMKPADCHRLEVWSGKELIYSRGQLDERPPIAHTRGDEPRYPTSAA